MTRIEVQCSGSQAGVSLSTPAHSQVVRVVACAIPACISPVWGARNVMEAARASSSLILSPDVPGCNHAQRADVQEKTRDQNLRESQELSSTRLLFACHGIFRSIARRRAAIPRSRRWIFTRQ